MSLLSALALAACGTSKVRIRWALGTCAVLVAIVAAIWFAAPWYISTKLLPDLWARYGLTVTTEREDLSLVEGAVEVYGVQAFDGKEAVLSAKRMAARISLRGLYEGRTILEHVLFDEPVVRARLGNHGRTNLGKILERGLGDEASPRPATLWKQILVHGGNVEWDDRAHDVRFRLLDIDAVVLDMETGSGERQNRFGQVTIDANLEQPSGTPALLSIVCWATPSGSAEASFVAHAALTGIDLDSFPGYVDAGQRAGLGVDELDLVVSMDVREGIIRRGAAVASSPGRTRPLTLLFGGPLENPVFDRSSQLFALWELPFSRLGRAGDVVWEMGDEMVGGVVDVIDGVVHGDLRGAGESAVGVVGGSVVALGSNTLDALESLGRALGLVAQEEARDTKAIHDRQRALFLSARREAAQAWARAHRERGS